MHKANVDSSLGPPVETDSMMNGHWDRLTSQQRYVHIQHAWLHKPRFSRNILSLDWMLFHLGTPIPTVFLNLTEQYAYVHPKLFE